AGRSVRSQVRVFAITVLTAVVTVIPAMTVRRPGQGRLGDLSAANAASFPAVGTAMLTTLALAACADRITKSQRWILGALVAAIVVQLLSGASWPLDQAAGVAAGWAVYSAVNRPVRADDAGPRSSLERSIRIVLLTA